MGLGSGSPDPLHTQLQGYNQAKKGLQRFFVYINNEFDVGIWSPTGKAFLGEIAKFIVVGNSGINWYLL